MPAIFAVVHAFGLALASVSAAGTTSAPLFSSPPPPPLSPAAAIEAPQPEKPAEKKEDDKQPEKKDAEKKKEPPAPSTPPTDPSTEDVLKDMEKQRGKKAPPPTPSTPTPQPTPSSTPSSTAPATAPSTAARPVIGRLLREGTFLVERRGRMVRASDGDWTFNFDADAQNQADPTMVLMPCQSLEAMEKLAERYGESLTLIVTGQVFVYKGRNHLLPARYRVERVGGDIKSTQ